MAAGSNNIVTDGLVGCWDAGNRVSYPGAGTTLTDLVNSNNGTLENGADGSLTFNSAKGGYLELDGGDDYIEIGAYGASSVLNWGSGNGTVGVWMKSDDHAGTLIAMGAAGSGGKRYLIQYDNDGNKISFAMDNDVTLKAANGSDTDGLKDDKWHYVVGMRIGQYIYLYVDGVLDATTDLGAGYGSVDYTSNGGLYMGGIWHVGDYVGHFWEGSLALAHIYNRALSADEVSQNYEALKPRFEPRITKSGMFANWDAGDPESYNGGQTWTDTANGFVGPFHNGVGEAISFDPANGGSLVFDGTDDRIGPIILPGDYSGTARSILLWVSPDTHESNIIAFNSADDKFKATVGQEASRSAYIFRADVGESSPQTGSFADSLITVGDWACIGMTINASDEIVSMYLNGVSKTGGSKGWNFQDDTYIGRSSSGAPWNGKIATVRLYTKTLSAAEVLDNYNTTKGRFGH